ncbi:family 10 glycosylhydrolase [Mangrovivirga cuniculi]|uniref:Glycosyl hydrolase-like 10 domain-containing protein n=1 Tax=Mangrovivirga cuniculi TaxID=2715131 RepID=A0A4D7KBG0_9BACT|nr:family 10 glycosylhydrolase [Mangrovivirga cuniculi]QCK16758.1 hypothetical protein DCC35_19485 [Mangrovivirga cuniculi]
MKLKFAKQFGLLFMVFSIILVSCSDDDEPALSDEREISYFAFEGLNPISVGNIDNEQSVINLTVPFGTDVTALAPTIEIPENATISPESGLAQDFTNYVIYTVTAQSGAKKLYTVFVNEGVSNDASIASFKFEDLFLSADIDQSTNSISLTVPFGTDLTSLTPTIVTAEGGSTLSPASGTAQDFSSPVDYTVTAPNGSTTETYTVTINELPDEAAVRGVWITNVDSDVLLSQENIQDAVDRLAELNFNTIFMVTWNKAQTTYPSDVMENFTGTRIFSYLEGRDPLREMIDAAHAKGIKVFAWFEYGFAANNGSPGPILDLKPEWAAINSNGEPVVKNGFHWMNSIDPEVQSFMNSLVMEVVNNYPDIDGIQGDDRLPAMPTEGGYDDYTVELYKSQHDGAAPPQDYQDGNWVQWRADILSNYWSNLYDQIKAANPNCIVASSPSPLTFGLREYLQDYGTWVKGGYTDIVSPQLYRRDDQGLGVYRGLLTDQIARVGEENIDKFYPGMLSFLGSYTPNPEYFVQCVMANREAGVKGEVQFFYNAVLAQPDLFRAIYPAPADFPTF